MPVTSPTPSTCPCTRCPPSRAESVTGRSRFTGSPGVSLPRVERASVSGDRSNERSPAPLATTVRHTPFTATEAPMSLSDDDGPAADHEPGRAGLEHDAPLLNDPGEHPPPPSGRPRAVPRSRCGARPPRPIGAKPSPIRIPGASRAADQLGRQVEHDAIDRGVARTKLHARVAPPSSSTPCTSRFPRCANRSARQTPPVSSGSNDSTSAPAAVHASTRPRAARSVVATSVGAEPSKTRASAGTRPDESTTTRSGGRPR